MPVPHTPALCPEEPLSGWGRHPVVRAQVCRPASRAAAEALLADSDGPLIAHGAGRSYGDAALPPTGARALVTTALDQILGFDAATGELRCEAGVRLDQILDAFVPRGWFLPVTPGTQYVTVGGAVAFDVHGKNHHRDGAFSAFVKRFTLVTATGQRLGCSRAENADVFWATLGGAGLTGLLTEVTFALRPLPSAFIDEHRFKARDLDDALALFDRHEAAYPYSVAWIDCLAGGAKLGRSLLLFGHPSPADALENPLARPPHHRLPVPFDLPPRLLNPWSIRAFNALYYGRQRTREHHTRTPLDAYFYPLDRLQNWNRMYGRRGFVQHQSVFPPETSRTALVDLLTRMSAKGWGSFLAVLKRFGPASEGLLSFPMPGYTLALDLPVRPGLAAFLDELNDRVVHHGGRVYLAKDAHLRPDHFRAMYPRLAEWQAVKARLDPEGRFASALSRRLGL